MFHQAHPFVREVAFMSAAWPQVHVDLSLALPLPESGALGPLIELLSLAPATKLMYGSDVHTRPSRSRSLRHVRRAVLTEPSTG